MRCALCHHDITLDFILATTEIGHNHKHNANNQE